MDNNASEKKDLSEERLIEEFPATELTDNNADSLTTDIEDEQSPIPEGKQPSPQRGDRLLQLAAQPIKAQREGVG